MLVSCWLNYILVALFDFVKIFFPDKMVKTVSDYCHIVNRDLRFVIRGRKALKRVQELVEEDVTIGDKFDKVVKKCSEKTAFVLEDSRWTFRDVQIYSNKICNLFGSWLVKEDVVILLMPNCPEFISTWLGLSKIGVISSFVNINLRQKPLLHCIDVARPKAIIYSKQFESHILEIMDSLETDLKLYCMEGASALPAAIDLPHLLEKTDGNQIIFKRKTSFKDVIIYIYTSGTTGLPKPAKVTHSKLFGLVLAAELVVGMKAGDVIYCPMPQYHTAGTTTAATCLSLGMTVILKSKFSASAFIDDCKKYKATVCQYIGEMIRYVVNTEQRPGERDHCLRLIAGNGLRSDVWKKFVQRFGEVKVVEYYGSTEGNFLLANSMNVVGSCGYLPIALPNYNLLGPSLIKVRAESNEPLRGDDGFCILADPGEPALCIGYCPAGNEMRKFHGYLNDKDSELKKIYNVFKKGDEAFNTGDLMTMDSRGWVTFIDRLGDTFRWKGENVSTAEVEDVINSLPFVADSAVYGVQVGNLEGKAGMASIVMDSGDLDKLEDSLNKNLAVYARPMFLRLVPSLEHTATYKVVKVQLKKEAFDISRITDPLFVRLNGKFKPLTADIYQKIEAGTLKL